MRLLRHYLIREIEIALPIEGGDLVLA
ncbi:MAG: hypothetical protein ACJA1W_001302, partial [Akkermansiaceae bacterium]